MEIESRFVTEELPPHTEDIHQEPSSQGHQLQEGHPLQEGTSSQYFGKLNATMEQIEKRQEQHENYIERLGPLYENKYEQQVEFNQQYHDRFPDIETQLEYIWVTTHPPPEPFDFPPPPPPPPSSSLDAPSSSYQPPSPPSSSK